MELHNMLQKAGSRSLATVKRSSANSEDDSLALNGVESAIKLYESKGYNMKYLADFLRHKGNALALSPAGSGKTISIILKLLTDNLEGQLAKSVTYKGISSVRSKSVLVTSFTRESALDLERTLSEESFKVGETYTNTKTRFSTLHSAYLDILKEGMHLNINLLTDNAKINAYIRAICKKLGVAKGFPTNNDVNAIISAISYLDNRVDWLTDLDAKGRVFARLLSDATLKTLNITKDLLEQIRNEFIMAKKADNVCTFDDLQTLLYDFTCGEKRNEHVVRFVSNCFDYIIIDEFQDVSQIQYELLKVMAAGDTVVIVVGDSNQSIYGFRGSDTDIILNRFEQDFKPKLFNFKISYRCPSVILHYANELIKHNEQKFSSDMEAYKEGGQAVAYGFEDYESMVVGTYKSMIRDVNEGKSVAILVGTNFDLLPLAIYTDLQNEVQFKIGGTLYDLTSPKISNLLSVMSLMENDCDIDTIIKQFKIKGLGRYAVNQIRKQIELMDKKAIDLPTAFYSNIDYTLGKIMAVFQRQYERLKTAKLTYSQKMLYLLDVLEVLQNEEWIKSIPDYYPIRLAVNTICNTYSKEINSYKDFQNVLAKVNQHLRGYANLPSTQQVIMTTVHAFKGLEADSVYAFNMVEGSLPRSAALRVEGVDMTELVAEERRLAYILFTRARQQLQLMTVLDNVSRFIRESGIDVIAYDFDEEVTLLSDDVRREVRPDDLFGLSSEEDGLVLDDLLSDGEISDTVDEDYEDYEDGLDLGDLL